MSAHLERKERELRALVSGLGRAVVAFSGGVDSALVLHVATEELGDGAIGITAHSASLPQREKAGAAATARESGAVHEILETREVEDPRYAANPANRCYFCKVELYGRLSEIARERGAVVLDGFNLDDESDWRPGRKAAREFGVRSPLAETGFRKDEVRSLARSLGLSVWDKPATACLSSRFPYGTEITLDLLAQVERAEQAVLDAGLRECRVRHHGEMARIEVPPELLSLLLEPARKERVVAGVLAAGYRDVVIDPSGYVRGGLNPQQGTSRRP